MTNLRYGIYMGMKWLATGALVATPAIGGFSCTARMIELCGFARRTREFAGSVVGSLDGSDHGLHMVRIEQVGARHALLLYQAETSRGWPAGDENATHRVIGRAIGAVAAAGLHRSIALDHANAGGWRRESAISVLAGLGGQLERDGAAGVALSISDHEFDRGCIREAVERLNREQADRPHAPAGRDPDVDLELRQVDPASLGIPTSISESVSVTAWHVDVEHAREVSHRLAR